MTSKQAVKTIQETFDINAIYARRVFASVDASRFLEEAAEIIASKPKPFVKWVGGKCKVIQDICSS